MCHDNYTKIRKVLWNVTLALTISFLFSSSPNSKMQSNKSYFGKLIPLRFLTQR